MFYGWKLSGLTCCANILLQGGGVYILNALLQPLATTHGWSRGDLGTGMTIAAGVGMLSASVFAKLLTRDSIRPMMTAGACAGALGYILMGQTDKLWLFTLGLCLVWAAGQACGGAAGNILMARWFISNRGKAFGFANVGTSLSGAVLPLSMFLLMRHMNAEMALLLLGGLILCIVAPLCWFMVRDPEDMGLTPDGVVPNNKRVRDETEADAPSLAWIDIIRRPDVWRVGLTFAFGIMMAAGLVGQLKPKFSDSGFSDETAMILMTLTAFFGAVGKYFWGFVSDRISPLLTTKILCLASMASLTLHFLPQNIYTAGLFVFFAGGCMGGFWSLFPNVTAYVFGRQQFNAVYSVLLLFISIKAIGYYVIGFSYTHTASYDLAYAFFIVILGVAFILICDTQLAQNVAQ